MDIFVNERSKVCYGMGVLKECERNQHCCSWGCCGPPTPAFQFYQLWYYWLLVILMFMLCSGGGWWYRYWLSGRYPDLQHTRGITHVEMGRLPPSESAPLPTQFPFNRNIHRHCVRVSYDPGRHRLLMHQLWKGPTGMIQPPPSYSLSVGDSTTLSADPMPTIGPIGSTSPYFQLYGPPPSYDSVVGQSSGVVLCEDGNLTSGPSLQSTSQDQPVPGSSSGITHPANMGAVSSSDGVQLFTTSTSPVVSENEVHVSAKPQTNSVSASSVDPPNGSDMPSSSYMITQSPDLNTH